MTLTEFRQKHGNEPTQELLDAILITDGFNVLSAYIFLLKHGFITKATKTLRPGFHKRKGGYGLYQGGRNRLPDDMWNYSIGVKNGRGESKVAVITNEWEIRIVQAEMRAESLELE